MQSLASILRAPSKMPVVLATAKSAKSAKRAFNSDLIVASKSKSTLRSRSSFTPSFKSSMSLLSTYFSKCSAYSQTSPFEYGSSFNRTGYARSFCTFEQISEPSTGRIKLPDPVDLAFIEQDADAQQSVDAQQSIDGRQSGEDREPVVMMHGLLGAKRNFHTISLEIARSSQRRVFTVDLRNHGQSPHTAPHNFLAMAADILHFLDVHKIKSAALIGHSMGAKAAMAVALLFPERVSSLIALDNSPANVPICGETPRFFEALAQVDRHNFKTRKEIDSFLSSYVKDLDMRNFLLTNVKREFQNDIGEAVMRVTVPLQLLRKSLDEMGEFPLELVGRRYTGPTLFVRGTKSRYVPDDLFPVIGAYFPKFKHIDVDSGHWVHAEKPKETAEAIVDFLNLKYD